MDKLPVGAHGGSRRQMCQWPECKFFAVREISHGPSLGFVKLCTPHARDYLELTLTEAAELEIQPIRRRKIG